MSDEAEIIRISIREKTAVGDDTVIVCGNRGYRVEFDFDDEWNDHPLKTMRVENDGGSSDVIFSGSSAALPPLYGCQFVRIGVFTDELASTFAVFECMPSSADDGMPEAPPEDVYTQLFRFLTALEEKTDELDSAKLDTLQGVGNAGKALIVGADGNAVPGESDAVAELLGTGVRYLALTQSKAETLYDSCLGNLPMQTVCYVNHNWVTDAPNANTQWVVTYAGSNDPGRFAMQLAFPITGESCFFWRIKRFGMEWEEWEKVSFAGCIRNLRSLQAEFGTTADADDITAEGIYYVHTPNQFTDLPVSGRAGWLLVQDEGAGSGNVVIQTFFDIYTAAIFQRYRVGLSGSWKRWISSDGHEHGAVYYAFGDSTTYGQTSDSAERSPFNYPACVGRMLHMEVKNKGVKGQGLLKDWDTIHSDFVSGLDMADARLITVGWAYNDTQQYAAMDFGEYTDTTDDTVIGRYFTIMKEFQQKCPTAQVVLITGYGAANGGLNAGYTFADGEHTAAELYNELEKMCSLHGWCCVNQAKGSWVNEFSRQTLTGDGIHPAGNAYLSYGSFIAARVASLFANIGKWNG